MKNLPLPVARLRRRSHNAKSSKERHDAAWYAWEVSIRLGVAAHPPQDASGLVRATTGQWASALNTGERPLQEEALLALHSLFTESGLGNKSARRSLSARELLDASVAYRNRVIGHGSPREASFYEKASATLLRGLDAAWDQGLFLDPESALVYSESVWVDSTGQRRCRWFDLSGEAPLIVDPRGSSATDAILPRRLYLRRGTSLEAIHPFALFVEEGERFACFSALGRRAEYLDYASGELLDAKLLAELHPTLEHELEALFKRRAPEKETQELQGARRFGDYEILGKLGEGAMGAVYLARQRTLDRLVALKMLPWDRAQDPVALGRFKREVKALSRCEHPNVVKIFSYGETVGTHYYAMEYVEGSDLRRVARFLPDSNDFETAISSASDAMRAEHKELFENLPQIERHAPSLRSSESRELQLARFFRDAGQGLAHLHERGVLHRDISPGNLMATASEGRAVVMDLGLAAVEGVSMSLTKDKSQILGTLRYIAPEQLQRSLLSVDRRADVYSLGASLYELLSDQPFFDGESDARLIEQVIREDPKPLSSAAPRVPEDLAVIVHKATDKDPAQRYESAQSLAADLDNFLEQRPITARPPTAAYLLSKWIARNRALTSAMAAALVILIAGAVTSTLFAVQAKENADVAADNALTAHKNEESARKREAEALAAQRRAKRVTDFVQKALMSSDPNQGGVQDYRVTDAMAAAVRDLDAGELKDDPETEASLQLTIADILDGNGESEAGLSLAQRSLETRQRLHPGDHADVAEALTSVATCLQSLGRRSEALPEFEDALAMCQRLYPGDNPNVAGSLYNVADCLDSLGKSREALPGFLAVLEMNRRLFRGDHADVAKSITGVANCLDSLGHYSEALPLYEDALCMWLRLRDGDDLDVATCLNNLASCLESLNRNEAALPKFEAALGMRQRILHGDHPDVANSLNNVAWCFRRLGRGTEALAKYEASLEMRERLFPGDHPDAANGLNNLADCLLQLGRGLEALPKFEDALKMRQRLFKGEHPVIAMSLSNLALCLSRLGRSSEALPYAQQAVAMGDRVLEPGHAWRAQFAATVEEVEQALARTSADGPSPKR